MFEDAVFLHAIQFSFFFTTGRKLSRINSFFSCCQLLLWQILSAFKRQSAAVILHVNKIMSCGWMITFFSWENCGFVALINQTICDYNKGPFNSQDLNTNSPFCLAYISFLLKCWEFGVESYDISFLIIFLILITYLFDIEQGEIASWSLLRVRG